MNMLSSFLISFSGFILALLIVRISINNKFLLGINSIKLSVPIFLLISSLTLIAFTFLNGVLGIKFDEHYIALGGYYISKGLIPHVDFFIPNGSFIYYLQSLGNFLFKDIELAYSFSASLVGVLTFIFITLFIKSDLRLEASDLIVLFLIYLFTFFAVSGCLWYNQLSAIIVTICLIIIHKMIIRQQIPSQINNFLLHILPFLCFLTKLDTFLVSMLIIISSLVLYTRYLRLAISILLVTAFLTTCYIYYYKLVYNINPLESMNYGQTGFDHRIKIDFYYIKKIILFLFLSTDNLAIRIVVMIHFILFINDKKWQFYKLDYFSYSQLTIFILSAIITVTSGRGAGFINSHFTFMSCITLVYFIKKREIQISKNLLLYISFPLVIFFTFLYYNNHLPKFDLYKRANRFYFASNRTNKYFDAYDQILNSFNRKVVVFSWFKYFLLNEKVSLNHPSKYLWEDLGTTVNRNNQQRVKDYFTLHKPDVIIESFSGKESFFNRLFENPEPILSFIKKNYDIYYKGRIDLIGSGGGNKFHSVIIYRIKDNPTR